MHVKQKYDIVEYDTDPSGAGGTFKSHVRQILKKAFRRFGIYIYRSPPDNGTDHLRALFQKFGINCVIDVGAHYGEYGRRLRNFVDYRGRIASFEPTSEAYEKLERRAASDPDWRIINCALGASSSEKEINITRYTAVSSLLAPSPFANKVLEEKIDVVGREKVKIRTLDEMFDWCVESIPQPRIYLKLDTQGYDIEVLRGAAKTIDRVLAMQSEVSAQPIYKNMPRMSEAIEYFDTLGFRITGLFAVTRAKDHSVIEFDCILSR
jgi:FkbM family methyltransferase